MPSRAAPLVVILAYDGLCPFEFGCAVEVFALSRPELAGRWYRCAVAAAEPGPLRGIAGLQVQADGGLELLAEADTVVIPGWREPAPRAPAPLLDALRQAHGRGARLVSICAGAFVLGLTGLLAGRSATTHWRHVDRLAQAFPDIAVRRDVLYVDEGSLLTSAGSAAGLDLCLHLVRRDFGAGAANSVARRLVIAAQREGGQAQLVARPVPRRPGTRLMPLLDRIRSRLAEPWPVERMAAEAGLSLRGVHRHIRDATGLPPAGWVQAERLAVARELLEETTLPVEAVARQAGFGAAAALRQQLRRATGLSPAAYRARFDRRQPPV